MKNDKRSFVGIDISKDTFNAYWENCDKKYSNNRKGWNMLLREAPVNSVITMEATGNYHYKLAVYAKQKGYDVKVFNPYKVRSFIKSLPGHKAKTDKTDARSIHRFATNEESSNLPFFELMSSQLVRARVIVSLLNRMTVLETACGNANQSHGLVIGKTDDLLGVLTGLSDVCGDSHKQLEKELCSLARELYPKQFRLLQTITGIGAKTAAVLLVSVKDINSFETSGYLSSFVGLVSRHYESGTTLNVNGHIVKGGNAYLRSLLYSCTKSAIQWNKPCSDLYYRLRAKGRLHMVAVVAVMHKLVKIAYGVVKSGEPFRNGKKLALA
ncbi:MAG: IS110 family transposase [Fibromonadaceae bacterium]|jgi:transposase|nr:IS110 family transposase [Fibromonadaceae bacterium]